MRHLSRYEIIEYLVESKYPFYANNKKVIKAKKASAGIGANFARKKIKPRRDSSDFVGNQPPRGVTWGDVEKYKAKLEAKSDAELRTLIGTVVEEKNRGEEEKRFFNHPQVTADSSHRSKMPFWTVEEGVTLTFGKSPKQVDWEEIRPYRNVSTFASEYEKLYELASRAVYVKQLSNPTTPKDFAIWLQSIEYDMPSWMADMVDSQSVVSPGDAQFESSKIETDNNADSVGDIHSLSVFRSMENLGFNDISMRLYDRTAKLKIKAKNKSTTVSLFDLDLATKSGNLTAAGKALFQIVRGEIFYLRTDSACTSLSLKLRSAFNIHMPPFEKGSPVFAIKISDDLREKFSGERRSPIIDSTTVGDDIENSDADEDNFETAEDFLKARDPDYAPSDYD